jgi:hypothetical protein
MRPVTLFGYPVLLLIEVDGEEIDASSAIQPSQDSAFPAGLKIDSNKVLNLIHDAQLLREPTERVAKALYERGRPDTSWLNATESVKSSWRVEAAELLRP